MGFKEAGLNPRPKHRINQLAFTKYRKIPLLGTLVSEVSVAEEDSEILSSSRNSFARKCPPLLKMNACAGAGARTRPSRRPRTVEEQVTERVLAFQK